MKNIILFIIEGAKNEEDVCANIANVFFKNSSEVVILSLPAEMNIYMLYRILKRDNFESDIVEILRENSNVAKDKLSSYSRGDFSQIYYFFDFDEHANNLDKQQMSNIEVLDCMLKIFDNETENGKLYLSYPMIEALRDCASLSCKPANGSCHINRRSFSDYKNISSASANNNNVSKYDYLAWLNIISNFILRIACLFQLKDINRDAFIRKIHPLAIFEEEIRLYSLEENIFIISSFPEFLIDYSGSFWHLSTNIKAHLKKANTCRSKNRKNES